MTDAHIELEGDIILKYVNVDGLSKGKPKRLSELLESPIQAAYTEVSREINGVSVKYIASNNRHDIEDAVANLYSKTNQSIRDPAVRKFNKKPTL